MTIENGCGGPVWMTFETGPGQSASTQLDSGRVIEIQPGVDGLVRACWSARGPVDLCFNSIESAGGRLVIGQAECDLDNPYARPQ
ncbi:MAG: hypothetical protein JKP98_03685 [Rhodobacteraceae bacterium]|nr:hypothetical protein [Paracoccaceae bacterium]